MAPRKKKTPSDLTQAFELLRQELECLLADLKDPQINGHYNRICKIEEKGQDIVNKWVSSNFIEVEGYYMFATKFGSAAQFGFYFQFCNFQLCPLQEDADPYRWYVTFGKENDHSQMVFASMGFG